MSFKKDVALTSAGNSATESARCVSFPPSEGRPSLLSRSSSPPAAPSSGRDAFDASVDALASQFHRRKRRTEEKGVGEKGEGEGKRRGIPKLRENGGQFCTIFSSFSSSSPFPPFCGSSIRRWLVDGARELFLEHLCRRNLSIFTSSEFL